MKRFNSFTTSSTSGRGSFILMLLIALALHGVFLLLPIGAGTKTPESSQEEEKSVQLQPSPSSQLNPQLSNDPTALGLNGQIPAQPNLSSQLSTNPTLSRANSQTLLQQKLAAQLSDIDNRLDSERRKPVRSDASQPNRQTRSQSPSTRGQSTPHRQGTSAVDRWRQQTSRQQASRQQAATEAPSTRSQEQKPATAESSSNSSQEQRPSTTSSSNSSQAQRTSATTPSSNSSQAQRASTPATSSNQSQAQRATVPPPPPPTQNPTTVTASREQKPAFISPETFFRDFPFYLGSLMTSGGVLQPKFNDTKYIYHTGDGLKDVAAHFKKQLKDKGFEFTPETDEENFKVYKVSRGNTAQFLHLVSQDDKTAIFLASESHSLDELENNEQPEDTQLDLAKFYDTFKQKIIDNQDLQLQKLERSHLETFPELEALQNISEETDGLELDKILEKLLLERLEVVTSPEQPFSIEDIASKISSELSHGDAGFNVEQIDSYGGGNLYQITQDDDFKIYMILVSSQEEDAPRTGIIMSKNDPRD